MAAQERIKTTPIPCLISYKVERRDERCYHHDYLVIPQHQYVWPENCVAAFLMRLMIECFDKTPSPALPLLYKPVARLNPAQNCCRTKRQIRSAAHLNISAGNILLHRCITDGNIPWLKNGFL